MVFPRITKFKFVFSESMNIGPDYVGRLDKLAIDIYGDIRYYKPLAAANGIGCVLGFRTGVRPYNIAVTKDINDNNLDLKLDDVKDNHIPNVNDWNSYGDVSSGYSSDVYLGRLIYVPTIQSARDWLQEFETLRDK